MFKNGKYMVLILLLIVLAACRTKPKDKYTDTPTSGVVPVGVDESFEPVVEQEIEVFEGIYTLAGIVPEYQSEVEVINLLLKDSVRLAITTRKLTEEERASFESRKFFPKEIKIATDGIALIVNGGNQDSLISVENIRKILTGKITGWKELNPQTKLGKIELVFDHPNSSTVRYAIDSLCGGQKLFQGLRAEKTNAGVIDYVAQNLDALGIVGVSWLQNPEDSTRLSFLQKVRVMGVSRVQPAIPDNSYKPWQAYLALGDYPLTRDVYAILTDPRGGLASGFTSFLASDRGQRIILKSGIIPATQPVRIVDVKKEW